MLRQFRETLKNKQRGAIMVFFAILVPLFLGVIGLAVDAGFLYMQKAKLQDVADATALAGAGHLKDGNDRDDQVASAVKAFAGANGYKDYAASSNFSPLGDKVPDSSVTLEENASWKIAYAIDTGMEDKDAKNGELRDHVRVVILKRVPTFFIRMLFPEQQEVVVKAVAAAEYVEGEEPEPVISGDTPVIFVEGASAETFQCYESANNIVLGKNFNFPIYIKDGNIDTTKLPGTGNLYVSNVLGATAKYDESKNNIAWDPPINNRNIFFAKGTYPAWPTSGVYWTDEKKKQELEAFQKKYDETRAKADAKYEEVKNKLISEANTKAQDIEAYKKGEGIKRYIGLDASGKPYSNIKEEDKTIELYMSGTYFETTAASPSVFFAWSRSVITNRQLKNVKTITTLVSDKPCMIGTTGITYGNIYLLEKDGIGLDIAGRDNNFNGTLYSPGNLYVGGENNHFLGDTSSSAEVSILGKNVYLGKWIPVSESIVTENSYNFKTNIWKTDECVKIDYHGDTLVDAKNDSNWRIYFGYDTSASSSGSSSGSSGSGAAKAHVRLVI